MTTHEPLFLMSPPRPDWGLRGKANFLSAASTTPPTPRGALQDWLSIANAIEEAGGHVVVLPPPPQDNLTGLPYVAEAGHSFLDGNGRVGVFLPRMKPAHRAAESMLLAGFYAALGFETRAAPGLWEGQGDVIRVDAQRLIHTVGEGPHARTTAEAYSVIAPALSAQHIQLRFKADPWFHGNTFLGAYHAVDGTRVTVLVCPEALLGDGLEQLRAFVAPHAVVTIAAGASRAYATNALQVRNTVLAPRGLQADVFEVWRDLGLRVVELDLDTLFRSGGGAAVCLTNRLDGVTLRDVPQHLRYVNQAEHWRARLEEYPATPVL
jgi:N-dimethylarginine dimethylaminohydrolase